MRGFEPGGGRRCCRGWVCSSLGSRLLVRALCQRGGPPGGPRTRPLGADPAAIETLRAEATVFSDGSLGCAKPGEVYIQVLTPGYHVVLGHEGRTYDYRATETGHFVLCEGPLAPAGAGREGGQNAG